MLDSFRRFSKSRVGTGILVVIGLLILASFALSDVSSLRGGSSGMASDTLARVGGRKVTDRDLTLALGQLLNRARQQNPAATMTDLAGEMDPLLETLIQGEALNAFGDKNGLNISKLLFDAEIAKLPAAHGLDGRFSNTAYQAFLARERLTDADLRRLLAGSLAQRLMLTPAAANARLGVGMASPYATMLMEQRQGELALVPISAFAATLKPTDAQLTAFYSASKARYTVPEQRTLRIARFGLANVADAAASEQEITAYYNANAANYAPKETRVISQALVPDPKVAASIASRARGGAPLVAAAQPAGLSATDVTVGPQTRAEFAELAGEKVAAAVFTPAVKAGTIVGPIQSDLGWHVIRVESIKGDPGKSLAAARTEIAAKLAVQKQQAALKALVDRVQDALDGGHSFADVAAANKLAVSSTPLLTAQGVALADRQFKLPPELAGAVKSGFELSPQDPPVIETLPGDAGFALVGVDRVQPAAPAPIAQVREQVTRDWIAQQGAVRARAAATAIAAKASAGMPLAQAVAAAGVPLPAPRPVVARRIELDQAPPAVTAAMKMLFSLREGGSRMVPAPAAQGFAIVRVAKIVPGSAMVAPTLIARVQGDFQRSASEEYARQFLTAVGQAVGIKRNDAAIAAARQRLTASPSVTE